MSVIMLPAEWEPVLGFGMTGSLVVIAQRPQKPQWGILRQHCNMGAIKTDGSWSVMRIFKTEEDATEPFVEIRNGLIKEGYLTYDLNLRVKMPSLLVYEDVEGYGAF